MHPPPDSFVPTPRAARFDLLVRGAPAPFRCVPRDAGWHPARRRSDRSAASEVTLAQHRSWRNPALLLRDPPRTPIANRSRLTAKSLPIGSLGPVTVTNY